jgi:hypothetical protein
MARRQNAFARVRPIQARYAPLATSIRAAPPRQYTLLELSELAGVDRARAQKLANRLVREGVLTRVTRVLFVTAGLAADAVGPGFCFESRYGGYGPGEHFALRTAMRLHGHDDGGGWGELLLRAQVTWPRVALVPGVDLVRFQAGKDIPRTLVEAEVDGFGPAYFTGVLDTVLDGLDLPERSGGFLEVVRFLAARHATFTPEALVDASGRHPARNLHRLGHLLERLGHPVPPTLLPPRVAEPHYRPLDSSGPRASTLDRRWQLRLNVEEGLLVAALQGVRGG